MSRDFGQTVVAVLGFPRVSGDEPLHEVATSSDLTFSPRERG